MWTSLKVAASGMQAQQRALEVASNNLANLQTDGFKARRPNLADQPPVEVTVGVVDDQGNVTLETYETGQGARLAGVVTNLAQGALRITDRPLDVAIAGEGFLEVTTPDGRTAYTRDGALQVDATGQLTTAGGAPVRTDAIVPAGATQLSIARDGTIRAQVEGESRVLGSLSLVRFSNPEGLEAIGGALLAATANSGDRIVGAPESDGLGALVSGSLESSNVDTGEEYIRVMNAQRAYQLNARALRTVDEMLQGANNLRR